MRSLVTGAAGFIGGHLVEALVTRGETVLAVDNSSLGAPDFSQRWADEGLMTFIGADLARPDECGDLLVSHLKREPVDAIWHLAANSDIPAGMMDLKVDLQATFLTTIHVLELARRFHIPHLYFTSSSAVYGERRGRIEEDSGPLVPISNYGAMKLAGEAAISAATAMYLSRGLIFRLPNVVGPRPTHGLLFDLLARLAIDPDRLEVLGDGTQCKPYMHVGELVEAMLFVRDRAQEKLCTYNLGPEDEGIPLYFIVEILLQSLDSSAEVHFRGGDRGWIGDIPRYSYSTSRLNRMGWRSRLSSEEAVRQACAELAVQVRRKLAEARH